MGSETSEQVMALLKELAMLNELDKVYEANPTEGERKAYRLRQKRHGEVTAEIKGLASEREKCPKCGIVFVAGKVRKAD